jgi:hypothetical protein
MVKKEEVGIAQGNKWSAYSKRQQSGLDGGEDKRDGGKEPRK